MKIMIVDDSAAMRMIVKKTVKLAGFEGHDFSEAEDGAKALAAIRADSPELVLCGWLLPNVSGIELLETLAAEAVTINFGFVTTTATDAMRTRAAAAGAKFVISSPLTPETFKAALTPYIQDGAPARGKAPGEARRRAS